MEKETNIENTTPSKETTPVSAPLDTRPIQTPQPNSVDSQSEKSTVSHIAAMPENTKGQNTVLLVVGLLFLLLLLVGGSYLYIKATQTPQMANNTQPQTQSTPSTVAAEPSIDQLDADLKGIDLGDVESDFKDVDTTLQGI